MFSLLLFGIGTAYAVPGIADDVPGQDIVTPIICGNCGADHVCGNADDSSGLNTLIAIAEVSDGTPLLSGAYPKNDNGQTPQVCMHLDIRNYKSCTVLTKDHCWSPYDIEGFDCKALTNNVGTSMQVTIDGVIYNVGYVIYTQYVAANGIGNRMIAWEYLVDLEMGFASGLNGLSMEDGVGSMLQESAGTDPITARDLYPRYYINNDSLDSWTWWIILAGRNEVGINGNGPTCGTTCASGVLNRVLTGYLCDEAENCIDFGVGIPYEVNIINVEEIAQLGAIWPMLTYPKKGFAVVRVAETGDTVTGTHIEIDGTINPDINICGLTADEFYSMFGWSYERATSTTLPITGNWDVVHTMHRTYCANSGTAGNTPGVDCTATSVAP